MSAIYFDNNATTLMPQSVQKALIEWINKGNPSSSYKSAEEARQMMRNFKQYLADLCGFTLAYGEIPAEGRINTKDSEYRVIFTSGASESNSYIITAVINSYAELTGRVPHLIVSAIEHKSILAAVEDFEKRGRIELTLVRPTPSGHISPRDIAAAIQPNTCLVCVMHANNETGAINNIAAIGAVAHRHNVPFHCDTVQAFGKFPINPITHNVDSFCISFHKLYGPPGVGALIVKQKFLDGYKLRPLIYGNQNDGLRGGTENLPGIGAAFAAIKYNMQKRAEKNAKIAALKLSLMEAIGQRFPTRQYAQYTRTGPPLEIVFLSGSGGDYLPNTLLLSVVKRFGAPICNVKLRTFLQEKGIIVSVGSACNTSNKKASHVLYAMGADEFIRRGALRISLGDCSTAAEVKKFVHEFTLAVNAQST